MPSPVRFTRICQHAVALFGGAAGLLLCSAPSVAQPQDSAVAAPVIAPSYVDLVELVQASQIVARITIDEQITVPPERAPGVNPGQVRLYIESLTLALLGGNGPVGESLVFLVDVPADERGRAPDIEEMNYLVFANRVAGRPGEIVLVTPEAMRPYTPELEARVRGVLTQVARGEPRPRITGIGEVISVPGNLAGESETQIFLATEDGAPVSLTVIRRPGMAPNWGVSWTEIVDQAARPPEPETLEWYALACSLPPQLPQRSFLQRDRESRQRAEADYQLVLDQLGDCRRNL